LVLLAIMADTGCSGSSTTPGVITTVAGNGTQGYSGDCTSSVTDCPATNAELSNPRGVAVDASGNLYIADAINNRVREVAVSTGKIKTIVGGGSGCTGQTDSIGDGCAAISAELNFPVSVALDGAGNLYVVDQLNQRVREVAASTGVITTVAGIGTAGYSGDGSLAISAELSSPTGLAVTAAGDLYIADSVNARVRKVTASSGLISTVAGNGTPGYSGNNGAATSAQLNNPAGVALDSSGNLYIADFANAVVRKVTVSTGVITTVAGNAIQGFSGDNGAAISAQLNDPTAMTLDASGNLFIADAGNDRVRIVTASNGVITTVVGGGTSGSVCSTGQTETDTVGDGCTATAAELNNPAGLALDSSGSLYIADVANNRIRKVVSPF
jgi:sugar lactone lactonase YvrE